MPDVSPDPTSSDTAPKRRFRLRYSLWSLLLFMLLLSASLALWRDWSPWRIEHVLRGHVDAVVSAKFSPDGRHILTASYDHTARVWDAETGHELSVLKGHEAEVSSAAFSPDGRRIVTASFDGTARVWDGAAGRELFVVRGHGGPVRSTASFGFSIRKTTPAGSTHIMRRRRFGTANEDGTAHVWWGDIAQKDRILHRLQRYQGCVNSAVFSPDGRRIATASEDGSARVWDAEKGRILHVLKGHEGWVNSAVFSPHGRRLVTAGGKGYTARLWEAETGHEISVLNGHENIVWSAAFSPVGHRIVTASGDRTARVWDSKTSHELYSLKSHELPVRSAAFSSDGRRIVTASWDKTTRVWRRVRPEQWWGVFWLAQFWAAVLLAPAFLWSLRRDYKMLIRPPS